MKIGLVCYPSLGGSGILATSLGSQLALRGHEVHLISYDRPFALPENAPGIQLHQVEIHPYELFKYPDYNLALTVKIASVSREAELDVLHVHYAIPHAVSAFLAKQLLQRKLPAIVTTLHGTDITLVGSHPPYFDLVKFGIERSDAVTAVSKALRRATRNLFHPDKEITVIPNFFVPDETLQPRPKGREKVLIHISNFRPVKRVHDVIEIFEAVAKQLPARLILVGGGGCIEDVRDDVARRGLQERVLFAGVHRNPDRLINEADLMLLPSEQESFGLAALEAMSYGVPVVASNVGGLPELIEDGVSGCLKAVGAIGDMAQEACALLSNETRYQQMALAAKERARRLFSAERIVPLYEEIYASAS